MKIQNLNLANSNVAFQKTKILTYQTKNSSTNENTSATLYKLDKNNLDDINEMETMNCPISVQKAYFYNPFNTVYMLQDDKEGTPIAFAETTLHKQSLKNVQSEKYLNLSILAKNLDYKNPEIPFYTQAINEAQKTGCDSIHLMKEDKTKQIVTQDTYGNICVVRQNNFPKSLNKMSKEGNINFSA